MNFGLYYMVEYQKMNNQGLMLLCPHLKTMIDLCHLDMQEGQNTK